MDAATGFAALAAFCVVVYVLDDGFDLGVGILFPLAPSDADRDLMMASVEPVWDGNETWLVLGGTLLWAAFPAAYYVLLPAFYLPIMLMLFALLARGIAFGFRFQATRFQRAWDHVFASGSIAAAFAQGLVLGGYLGGVRMESGVFAGSPLDCLGVLGLLCGLGMVAGYALLGAGWLILKTETPTQGFARRAGRIALVVTVAAMLAVSGWTALTEPAIAARWFGWPNIAALAPVPLVTAIVAVAIWRSLGGPHDGRAFWLSMILFLLGFAGLIVSIWPFPVPRQVTIYTGVADPQTLWFIGVGLAIVVPVVIAYQAHGYWVFRGKAHAPAGHGPYATAPTLTVPTAGRSST